MANTTTMSKHCGDSELFGSNLTHEQDDQDTVHGSGTHNESNITCNLPTQYMTQSTTLTITACVHVAIKLIYQDNNVSSSKNQSTTLAILLFEKHYLTDLQFLHPRNTFAKNVTNIY